MEVQFAQKAIIVKDGKVLLIQKNENEPHHPLKWEVPGGRLESDETIDDSLRREVFEEVGLQVSTGRPLAIWSWTLGEGARTQTFVAVARECSIASDDSTAISFSGHAEGDDIGSWKWVPVDEVKEYDLIPNARKAILDSLAAAV